MDWRFLLDGNVKVDCLAASRRWMLYLITLKWKLFSFTDLASEQCDAYYSSIRSNVVSRSIEWYSFCGPSPLLVGLVLYWRTGCERARGGTVDRYGLVPKRLALLIKA